MSQADHGDGGNENDGLQRHVEATAENTIPIPQALGGIGGYCREYGLALPFPTSDFYA